jgi:uncharacterized protein YcsI (UPF0317 family)
LAFGLVAFLFGGSLAFRFLLLEHGIDLRVISSSSSSSVVVNKVSVRCFVGTRRLPGLLRLVPPRLNA